MDLQRTDLNLMVAFEALMAEQSVSAAARRLGISQPAMSGALGRLRSLFGNELFVRSGRAMLPTARAMQLAEQIGRALAEVRAALEPPEPFDPATARRIFTVSGGDYATMVILPLLARRVAETAPFVDLRFRFIEKDLTVALLDTDVLDLALGVFPNPPKRLQLQTLFQERFVCVARQGHPDLLGGLTLDTFVALPHLLVTERGDAMGAVDAALAKIGQQRHVKLTVPHVLVVPSVLPNSDLIASVGARVAAMFARGGAVEIHEPPIILPAWNLSMLWSRQKAGDPGLAWLRGILSDIGSRI